MEFLDLDGDPLDLLGVPSGELPDFLPAGEQLLFEHGLLHGPGVCNLVVRAATASPDPEGVLLAPDGPPVAPALLPLVPPQSW